LMGRFVGTFLRVGIQDTFSSLCGNYPFLMESHGLAPDQVEARIRDALSTNVQLQLQS
jgi:transketolase